MLTAPPNPTQCPSTHDLPTLLLSLGLCLGLILSYLPQILRVIIAKSSEGFSPWYLLLGGTSSASGMLNLLIVQWPLFQCCRVVSGGACFESLLGFYQVFLQWLLFVFVLTLFMVYFPDHLKYHRTLPLARSTSNYSAISAASHESPHVPGHEDEEEVVEVHVNGTIKSVRTHFETTPEWRLAVNLTVVIALHVILLFLLSITLLLTLPSTKPPHTLLRSLALFLGASATMLAVFQYAPQIHKTYHSGLVGALSLGTMAIQVPGSIFFVISLAVREGTDWTSWLAYAITGILQGVLLVICLCWKRRQKRLGIDDFGNPLNRSAAPDVDERTALVNGESD